MPATSIDLEFADGSYTFALRLPQLAELQEKTGVGIFRLYGRVMAGRFYDADGAVVAPPHMGEAYDTDLFEVVRLGLIGGGASVVDQQPIKVDAHLAKKLVERYLHDAPLTEAWALAAAILAAKIEGYTPKKAEPAKVPAAEKPKRSRKASTSQT